MLASYLSVSTTTRALANLTTNITAGGTSASFISHMKYVIEQVSKSTPLPSFIDKYSNK